MMPLAAFPAVRTSDPEEVYASIRGRNPGARGLTFSRQRLHLAANHVRLGTTSLVAGRSSPYAMEIEPDDALRIQLPSLGRITVTVGGFSEDVPAGRVGILPSEALSVSIPDSFASTVAILRRSRVDDAMAALGCAQGAAEVVLARFGRSPIPGLDALAEQIRHTCLALDGISGRILSLEAFGKAHDDLVAIHTADALTRAVAAPEGSDAPAPRLLRRCLDYIEAHMAEGFSMVGLQRHAGVSLRSVQEAFRRHLDCTITGYLRRTRLAAARARLLRPQAEDTVTGIAVACGFNHLGEFASAYRQAYGEPPSATLQNARRRS